MPFLRALSGTFSIDRVLNPLLPPSPLAQLPQPLAHFLGYRAEPARPLGTLLTVGWTFVGVLASVLVIEATVAHIGALRVDGAAFTVASFGASAVLEFCAIESPLAQPRSAVGGQVLASIIGVSVARLFGLNAGVFTRVRFVAGALACAAATAAMALTGTVHPPAGATALIAVIDDRAAALGWRLIASVLLSAVLMQGVALLVNNVQRRFPLYWWTPGEVGQFWRDRRQTAPPMDALKRQPDQAAVFRVDEEAGHAGETGKAEPYGSESLPSSRSRPSDATRTSEDAHRIVITRYGLETPAWFSLLPDERLLLEGMCRRLGDK